jgi:hypothetical protein
MDPERPVHEVNADDKFWRAEDVAADDAWVLGPYARASLFSFVLMNVAKPIIYASPFPLFPFDILQVSFVVHASCRRG